MRPPSSRYLASQDGYTLVEVIISVSIGALLLSALTSVVFTSWRAANIATSRVEASSQIRSFEYFAYDDFALSATPNNGACTPATPCTTAPLVLSGVHAGNTASVSTPPTLGPYQVKYTWDGSSFVDREVGGGGTQHAATDVKSFSWYVDANSTVVVSLTVQVQAYSESQTFRFYPRMNP